VGLTYTTIADNVSQSYATSGWEDTGNLMSDEQKTGGFVWWYHIIAVNSNGESNMSVPVAGWKLGLPDAPDPVSATKSSRADRVVVTWSSAGLSQENSPHNQTDTFDISRADDDSHGTQPPLEASAWQTLDNGLTTDIYEDMSVVPGNWYWYRISAHNQALGNHITYEYWLEHRVWADPDYGYARQRR
jgi:hypothetical protein